MNLIHYSRLIATLVSTEIEGGSLFRTLEYTYKEGLYYALIFRGLCMIFLVFGQLIALLMGKFLRNFSIAETWVLFIINTIRIITGSHKLKK